MKKLLVVLMVLAVAGAVQANMLVNPGFESYSYPVDSCSVEPTFDGWTVWQWGGSTTAVSADAYDGVVSFSATAVPGWGGGAGAYQGFPMGAGYNVSISAYIKDLSLDGPAGAAGIDMFFLGYIPDPNGPLPDVGNLGRVELNLDGTVTAGASGSLSAPDENGWQYGCLSVLSPPGTRYMEFEVINNNNDGEVLFDKVVGVPEPVTIALLGLGGLLLRRRK